MQKQNVSYTLSVFFSPLVSSTLSPVLPRAQPRAPVRARGSRRSRRAPRGKHAGTRGTPAACAAPRRRHPRAWRRGNGAGRSSGGQKIHWCAKSFLNCYPQNAPWIDNFDNVQFDRISALFDESFRMPIAFQVNVFKCFPCRLPWRSRVVRRGGARVSIARRACATPGHRRENCSCVSSAP